MKNTPLFPPTRSPATPRQSLRRGRAGVTLVEAMVSLTLLSGVMLGIFSTFIASRKVTEQSLYHAAATSFIYGLVEQLKTIPYDQSTTDGEPNRLPAFRTTATTTTPSDAFTPTATLQQPTLPALPYVLLRLNESENYLFAVDYNDDPVNDAVGDAPLTIPPLTATAAGLGIRDNQVTLTLPNNQTMTINIWIWIDRLQNNGTNNLPLDEARKITLVYTYTAPGNPPRVIRDREVILRTGF